MPISDNYFAVVIPTMGQSQFTKECFDSLVNLTGEPFSVIWIQNQHQTYRSEYERLEQEFGDKLDLRVIRNKPNNGFTRAVNQGVELGLSGNWTHLTILNNDTKVVRNWHKRLVAQMPYGCGLIGPLADAIDDPQNPHKTKRKLPVRWTDSDNYETFDSRLPPPSAKGFITTKVLSYCCAVIPSEIWDEVGLLDERFGHAYGEDNDHSHRIRLAGYSIGIGSAVCIHHARSRTSTKILQGEKAKRYKIGQRQQSIFKAKWADGHPPGGFPPNPTLRPWMPYSDFSYTE
jgi:GT2 family glycosyltransferase